MKYKYMILLGDGFGGYPVASYGNRTSLEASFIPNINFLASRSEVGLVKTTPDGFSSGSDVTNLNILGYDPAEYYTGRSPLEAVSIGLRLKDTDMTLRCNLVTLKDSSGGHHLDAISDGNIMDDYSAGHIENSDAEKIIAYLADRLNNSEMSFHAGTSYRHILVWNNPKAGFVTTPPHDISKKEIGEHLPKGNGSDKLLSLMKASVKILSECPVNHDRIKKGKKPVNSIWLWGEGRKPAMPHFKDKFGLEGGMISAVDLLKGIGGCIGFEIIKVPGITGFLDTNFDGKIEYGLEALRTKDIIFIHVEAPDEAGHMGDAAKKIEAIEKFDKHIVGGAVKGLKERYNKDGFSYKILVLCDHYTPVELMTHTTDPVPYIIYDSSKENAGINIFSEQNAKKGSFIENGWELMPKFLAKGNI